MKTRPPRYNFNSLIATYYKKGSYVAALYVYVIILVDKNGINCTKLNKIIMK